MRPTVHRTISIAVLIVFCIAVLPKVKAQMGGEPIPRIGQPSQSTSQTPSIPEDMRRDMEKKANQQRQAELKRDAEKLLKLSTELKAYVDKTNEHVLSLDVVKKAEEIEKLAHSVRIKMRGDQYGTAGVP